MSVGELTILAVSEVYETNVEVFRGKIRMFYGTRCDSNGLLGTIQLGFIEPAHYVAVVAMNSMECRRDKCSMVVKNNTVDWYEDGVLSGQGVESELFARGNGIDGVIESASVVSEMQSTVGYDLCCCGVIVGGRNSLSEEVKKYLGRGVEEVRTLSKSRHLREKCIKVWAIHFKHGDKMYRRVKKGKKYYFVRKFDFSRYYKELSVMMQRKLVESQCMWYLVKEILDRRVNSFAPVKSVESHGCLNIISWNAAGFLGNVIEFEHFVRNMKSLPDVICIQETKLRNYQNCKIKGYIGYRKDKEDSINACGGVATYVREDIGSYLIASECEEFIKVGISHKSEEYVVLNVYVRGRKHISGLMKNVVGKRCILCGDFNAHHLLLGAEKSNFNGRMLEQFLEVSGLRVVNTLIPTRYNISGKGSVLDLFLVSDDLIHKCIVTVENESYGSDHRIVKLSVRISGKRLGSRPSRRFINWDKYQMESKKFKVEELSNAEEETERFINEVNNMRRKSMMDVKSSKRWRFEWWNNECDAKIGERRKAEEKVRKSRTVENVEMCKKKRYEVRRVLRKTKRECWGIG